jgi:hypothetical protein
MVDGGRFREGETVAGLPKLALDFLPRPATMTPRQHSGTQAFHKTGKTPLGDGNTTAAREGTGMAVWSVRWLHCSLCEQLSLFHVEIATGARVRTPTNDRRDNVLRTRKRAPALNRGGAIV